VKSLVAGSCTVDQAQLVSELDRAFGGDERSLNVVARQARDLADSGRLQDDMGVEATAETVVSNLEDAPAEYSVVQRWNWWIGSLDISHGGYRRFNVREDIS
jgi:hypothetical protein